MFNFSTGLLVYTHISFELSYTEGMRSLLLFHASSCCSLLLRRECCSFSNGEYVKAGLAELEHWCYKATDEVR